MCFIHLTLETVYVESVETDQQNTTRLLKEKR